LGERIRLRYAGLGEGEGAAEENGGENSDGVFHRMNRVTSLPSDGMGRSVWADENTRRGEKLERLYPT
jgi:hypothetical protein